MAFGSHVDGPVFRAKTRSTLKKKKTQQNTPRAAAKTRHQRVNSCNFEKDGSCINYWQLLAKEKDYVPRPDFFLRAMWRPLPAAVCQCPLRLTAARDTRRLFPKGGKKKRTATKKTPIPLKE